MAAIWQYFRFHIGLRASDGSVLRSRGYPSLPEPSESQFRRCGQEHPVPFLPLIRLATGRPGPSSRCAVRLMATCELLKIATVFTPCLYSVPLFLIVGSSASPIGHTFTPKICTPPVPRSLWQDLHSSRWFHTAASPTWRSSELDSSVPHIQIPALTLASFSLDQLCSALLAAVLSSSMMVLTTESSPGAGQFITSVFWPCSFSF